MAGVDELRRVFGIPKSVQIHNDPQFNVPQGDTPDPAISTSALGTPVYSNIEFLSEQYENKSGVTVETPHLKYDAILISTTQPKRIVKTEIDQRDGTVKEYIGKGDFELTISGVISGANGQHPRDAVSQLQQMLDAPVAIGVACRYLNDRGINLIVVESYEFPQEPGSYSEQAFIINCISDIPQELRIEGE